MHTPVFSCFPTIFRLILNIHHLFTLTAAKDNFDRGCGLSTTTWTLVATSVSHILLTLNSSVNFFIYCGMSPTFRDIFFRLVDHKQFRKVQKFPTGTIWHAVYLGPRSGCGREQGCARSIN